MRRPSLQRVGTMTGYGNEVKKEPLCNLRDAERGHWGALPPPRQPPCIPAAGVVTLPGTNNFSFGGFALTSGMFLCLGCKVPAGVAIGA